MAVWREEENDKIKKKPQKRKLARELGSPD